VKADPESENKRQFYELWSAVRTVLPRY